ncbi:DsrH/TusB family sulfur metabolism protein [Candidatus Fukatsuia anoeciicola]|uniref:DsrH/TusB family sulfur metabolism protein n=1 Tax=Candidatus Fukatsuia anoeciicola TaxID=2994492 RepID=UPI003464A30A
MFIGWRNSFNKKNIVYKLILSQLKNLFVLEDDLVIQDLHYQITDYIKVINYNTFINLTIKHY